MWSLGAFLVYDCVYYYNEFISITNLSPYRDLKSANILVTEENILKISDFGTSKQRNDQSTKMSFAGTYAYM